MPDYYRGSEDYAEMLRGQDRAVFAPYVDLWKRFVKPADGPVIDIGCGVGTSTLLLRQEGYHAVGSDVSSRFLPGGVDGFIEADFTSAPHIASGSFAAAGCMNVIEHVETPARFLEEMVRSVRPGGHILLLAPHLSTPLVSIGILRDLLKGKTPYLGVTSVASAVHLFFANSARVLTAELGRDAFAARQAVLDSGIVGHDADAVYWTNAAEIRRFLVARGCEVKLYQQQGRTAASRLVARHLPGLAGQLCIVARKVEDGA